MHQLERMTPKRQLAWRKEPDPYHQAVGRIEFLLWSHGGELPLSVEIELAGNKMLQLVGELENAGYKVEFTTLEPTKFHLTLS